MFPDIPEKGSEDMPVSEAQKRATAKYEKERYDKYQMRLMKGKKEVITSHAAKRGESLNGFLNRAVDETMVRDNADGDSK